MLRQFLKATDLCDFDRCAAVRETAGLVTEGSADHVQCEAWVDGWQVRDPSRDAALERGLQKLGIPLERIPVVSADGVVHYRTLASLDDWAGDRQAGRNIREQRHSVFAEVNRQFEKIRQVGRQG